MEWYWIVLICLGYYLMWIVGSIIAVKIDPDSDIAPVAGFFWWLYLPVAFIIWITDKYDKNNIL